MGWRVFPVFAPDEVLEGRCSCGDPACNAPAKHPRTSSGFKAGTQNTTQIKRFFQNRANVAIATGNGLMVVDVDLHRNPDALRDFEEKHGALPETLTAITGKGGLHFYFRVDRRVPCSSNRVFPGIDIRGDEGYVVAPPSLHASGQPYIWHSGKTYRVTQAPAWLIDLALSSTQKGKVEYKAPDAILEGGRNDWIASVCGTLHKRGLSKETITSTLLLENKDRCRPPLGEDEVYKIVESITSRPPGDLKQELGEWSSLLKRGKDGTALPTAANAAVFMLYHEKIEKALAYNEFSDEVFWAETPPDGPLRPVKGDALTDDHLVYLQHWLARHCGPSFGLDALLSAAQAVAKRRTIHPVREYLDSLVWDGKPRVDTWVSEYLGADRRPILQKVGAWWMLSAVARVLYPGCQADYVLVLEGYESEGKSSACRILGGEFFLGQMPKPTNPLAGLQLQGYWIVEAGEMASLKRVPSPTTKDFITQTHDVYRRPYSRTYKKRPRQCVVIATTNEDVYLEDPAARRWWPVKVKRVDLVGLKRDRDQLWAEAVQRVKEGEKWYPGPESSSALESEQADRQVMDPWEEKLLPYLMSVQADGCTVKTLFDILGINVADVTKAMQMRIADLMRKFFWTPDRRMENGKRVRFYRPTERWHRWIKSS